MYSSKHADSVKRSLESHFKDGKYKKKGKLLDEKYFENFDFERICIDKVFLVIYDDDYVLEDHFFDKDLRDRFIQHVKRSRIKKGRFEQVLRRESEYSSWELQLRGGRMMYFHINVIHYLQDKFNLKPENVIYDDNFLPLDSKLKITDFVQALREFIVSAMDFYKEIVLEYWNVELKRVSVKLVEVELPFEVYPASVEDIAQNLYSKGVSFRKYNTQSGTIYLNNPETDNSIHVDRKYDKEDPVQSADLVPDICYLNGINSGRSLRKIQLKIYQKTFGLCRIEFTIFSQDAKQLFDWSRSDNSIAEDLIDFMHFNLSMHDINVERYDRSLDDVVRFLAKAVKEPEDLIYQLGNMEVFEGNSANKAVRQRLVRKGILLKIEDSDNVVKRGLYVVNPILKEFLNMYKSKGDEHFVKNELFSMLN